MSLSPREIGIIAAMSTAFIVVFLIFGVFRWWHLIIQPLVGTAGYLLGRWIARTS